MAGRVTEDSVLAQLVKRANPTTPRMSPRWFHSSSDGGGQVSASADTSGSSFAKVFAVLLASCCALRARLSAYCLSAIVAGSSSPHSFGSRLSCSLPRLPSLSETRAFPTDARLARDQRGYRGCYARTASSVDLIIERTLHLVGFSGDGSACLILRQERCKSRLSAGCCLKRVPEVARVLLGTWQRQANT